MRQGQQNRRGRGRNNNNSSNNNNGRKQQNPLSRNYESSGPDVKIRGTAAQIAEKYQTLARDASACGDVITAENYLQHAEHYNRIIMTAQAQMQAQSQPQQQPSIGHHGLENGYAHEAPQRVPADYNGGAMRDQPQPVIMPVAGMDEQPVIDEAPAAEPPARQAPAAREPSEGGRRRRRRYPANGAERPAAAGQEPAANGNGADVAKEDQSTDEALA